MNSWLMLGDSYAGLMKLYNSRDGNWRAVGKEQTSLIRQFVRTASTSAPKK